MRGALEPLAGVGDIDVLPGRKEFWVAFDPEQVDLATLLSSLEAAGEPAKPAQ
ncbi:hypothetical protein Pla86_03970 [Planctomycetes bacterium Pla86]|uniref:HMA domain-containing protein n=1 Tax=Engelhardtia mirabilis TaxID=2528011 RepID=A0A518BEG1_9BACT|nr:hypothetical protein Pla133_03970 [Planctomycetes bacterium Pla133]QDU99658.1 hypothetical protein Pla86_03970 [Planctomycetes bacterium Pla86]